jgi:DNA-binding MarR family transcriptional regulator
MNETEAAVHLVETIPYLNRIVARKAGQSLESGLPWVHVRVLAHVRRMGSCSLNELAAQQAVSPATTSKLVSLLAEKGLVTRELHRADRRSVVIQLAGRESNGNC